MALRQVRRFDLDEDSSSADETQAVESVCSKANSCTLMPLSVRMPTQSPAQRTRKGTVGRDVSQLCRARDPGSASRYSGTTSKGSCCSGCSIRSRGRGPSPATTRALVPARSASTAPVVSGTTSRRRFAPGLTQASHPWTNHTSPSPPRPRQSHRSPLPSGDRSGAAIARRHTDQGAQASIRPRPRRSKGA